MPRPAFLASYHTRDPPCIFKSPVDTFPERREIRDIYEARAALFALMAQAVATGATDEEIASL
jgi:DNA-binding FadR family transcriptional regulator